MPRRHIDLFDGISSFAGLDAAAHRAVAGKRRQPGAAAFMARLEPELLRLQREMRDGSYLFMPLPGTEVHASQPSAETA